MGAPTVGPQLPLSPSRAAAAPAPAPARALAPSDGTRQAGPARNALTSSAPRASGLKGLLRERDSRKKTSLNLF